MTAPTLILTPRRPALLAGFDNTVDVLVQVQAPVVPASAPVRSPLTLAIVLDRSGSMSGQPLAEAKRCAGFVIDRLEARDSAALVIYDDEVEVLVPARSAKDKGAFHGALKQVESGGMTNLHGGWLAGTEQAKPLVRPNAISRVLLLSDGQANEGLTDLETIAKHCKDLARAGVTTSTYGLGRNFNEELMVAMARAGLGNSYYGETAEDLMDPFAEEFDLLSALFAKNLSLRVEAAKGVGVTVENRYPQLEDGSWRMPDLAYGGESWALLRVTVAAGTVGTVAADGSRAVSLAQISLAYQDIDGRTETLAPVSLALPVLSPGAWEAVGENTLTINRAAELDAANMQDEAKTAARAGDWKRVRSLLAEAKARAPGNAWLGSVVETLETLAEGEDAAMFAKEATYGATRMRTRLASVAEADADLSEPEPLAGAAPAAPAPSYLRKKAAQGKGFWRRGK